jgi:hypothetical protein
MEELELVLAKMSVPLRYWIQYVVVPIAGGLFCLSGVIIAKKPNAKDLFDKIMPAKGFFGVGMLAVGIWNAIDFLPDAGKMIDMSALIGFGGIGVIFSMIFVGFLLGMPQIAAWLPGESGAEKKGVELAKKLATFELLLGLIAIASAVLLAVGWLTFDVPKPKGL